jgi:hypothetical protein
MAAHGYRMRRESCPEFAKTLQASVNPSSAYDRAIHARCYLPTGWGARQIFKLERRLGRIPAAPA